MATRFHTQLPLAPDAELNLPLEAARHVQVLRLQPGAAITLFDGQGGEWAAEVLHMGRKDVVVRVREHQAVERELATAVTLALGMPANERMDALIEKATELGVAAIQPLVCERSVLRVAGDRAERKAAHWQAVAAAACEQSGRNRVPQIATPRSLRDWWPDALPAGQRGLLLSLAPDAPTLPRLLAGGATLPTTVLSGPEGGLSPAELAQAQARGFLPVSLGPRVLRADTAPLAALVCLGLLAGA